MISFHSFHATPKQDYLHSIHFHSLILKIQSRLLNSILFHSVPLLKYIPLISFPFPYDHFILFHFKPTFSLIWEEKKTFTKSSPPTKHAPQLLSHLTNQ